MNKQQIITKISEDIFPNGPNIEKTLLAVKNNDLILFDGVDTEVETVYEFSQANGFVSLQEKPKISMQEWLESQGFSSTNLAILFDLESRLAALSKSSSKMSAVRGWINNIVSSYTSDPLPRHVWTASPHAYSETITEAITALEAP